MANTPDPLVYMSPVAESTSTPCTAPTPIAYTCPTPGVYSYPATTLTLTAPVTVTTTYYPTSTGVYTFANMTTAVTCTSSSAAVPYVTTYPAGTYTASALTTTVTETSTVVYCPFETSTPVPVSTKTKATYVPAPTYKPKPKPKPKPTHSAPHLGEQGNKWAMTYTPYKNGGGCKGPGEVMADLTKIHSYGFRSVRVYSTDCDVLPNVGAACEKLGMKMILGVFVNEVGCENTSPHVQDQFNAIRTWGRYELVELAVVGNEAYNQKFCQPHELAALIIEMKTMLTAGGCEVPVTTADTVNSYQDPAFAAAICPVVDLACANVHAYFDSNTAPAGAGPFVKQQIEMVKSICGKDGYVLETGYPHSCNPNGNAVCSPSDQATAIKSIYETCGNKVVFFSYTDDLWKEPGACNCEQAWGCSELFANGM